MIEETKIEKVIYNQVSLVIAISGVIIGVMFWVQNPQIAITSRVQAVEQQVVSHEKETDNIVKYQVQQNEEIKEQLKELNSRQIEMLQAIAKLQATSR